MIPITPVTYLQNQSTFEKYTWNTHEIHMNYTQTQHTHTHTKKSIFSCNRFNYGHLICHMPWFKWYFHVSTALGVPFAIHLVCLTAVKPNKHFDSSIKLIILHRIKMLMDIIHGFDNDLAWLFIEMTILNVHCISYSVKNKRNETSGISMMHVEAIEICLSAFLHSAFKNRIMPFYCTEHNRDASTAAYNYQMRPTFFIIQRIYQFQYEKSIYE